LLQYHKYLFSLDKTVQPLASSGWLEHAGLLVDGGSCSCSR